MGDKTEISWSDATWSPVAARVPFYFKHWGCWVPNSHLPDNHGTPRGERWGTIDYGGDWYEKATPWNGHDDDGLGSIEAIMKRIGKVTAGRLLDGKLHDEELDL